MKTRRFTWLDGDSPRFSLVSLVVITPDAAGIVFSAQGLPHEQVRIDAIVRSCAAAVQHYEPPAPKTTP